MVRSALARAGLAGADPPFGREPASTPGGAAAVLVALFEEAGEARVLLTRRSEQLRTHRGQVSFPGGRMDPGERAVQAALREAHEEIGLAPASVEVTGWLHPVTTRNDTLVLPVVGVLAGRPNPLPNPDEVARVFDVALAELVAEGVYREERWDPPWPAAPPGAGSMGAGSMGAQSMGFFDVDGERVWGATARMLRELVLVVLGLPAVG